MRLYLTYEDDEIAFSAAEHIHAAGGWASTNLRGQIWYWLLILLLTE